MNHRQLNTTFAACMAAMLLSGNAVAQETFDLGSQRSEKQNVLPVPGHKIDHQGIVINPTPQQITVNRGASVDLSGGVAVNDRKGKFAKDLSFLTLNPQGVKLTIDYNKQVARKHGLKEASGAYALHIDKKGIRITGYDERGAFYGLQTLRQLMESPIAAKGKLPYVSVADYPSLPNRGVVEGFYGTPWSHEVRLSLIDCYGELKMNTYLYGPKDDPYHSCPNWRQPYPEKEARQIKELVEACNRNRVDFVWAIHPGQDIKWNEEDYQNLLKKFNGMYQLGVRHFAIFFDDITGEGTNPRKQTALLNRLTDEFVKAHDDVSPLTVCPTDYSKLWANPTPQGSLAIYGETLNPEIKVFWTGDVVCSDLTRETLDWVNSRIKRPAYYWWNYPVTDYVRHIILQGPVYGLNTELTERETCGVISNPMEHGEASKLALYSVADYAWNPAAYNAMDSWERGLAYMVPQATDAYRTFAIHSCDTENGYRRDEAWETETFRLAQWDDVKAQRLETEMERVAEVKQEIEQRCSNKLLLNELRPWLTEFEKLGIRGKRTIELARQYQYGQNDEAFWKKYVSNLMSEEDKKAYNAHKVGTMKLQPFYETTMDDMAFGFVQRLSGEVPMVYRGIGSFANSLTTQTKLMLDADIESYYTTGEAQKDGSWIGLDLRAVRPVNHIEIVQGRNSKDDVDYFDHAALEYSADGKTWTALLPDLEKQYEIEWKGDAVMARYVRLKRLDSTRKNYATVREFRVNPEATAHAAFDLNPHTIFGLDGQMEWDVTPGTKRYTILSQQPAAPLLVKQLDAQGQIVAESSIEKAFAIVEVASDAVARICIEGQAQIMEIVRGK